MHKWKHSTFKTILIPRISPTVLAEFSQPAWDVSERSQSDLHWERYLRDLSETTQKRCIFCDVFSKKCLFCDVFKTSQKHLKKDAFSVTSLRRLDYISKKMFFPWRLWDVLKTSLASIFGFSKIRHKKYFVWFPWGHDNIWLNRCGTVRNTQEMKPFEGAVHRYQSSLPSGLISTWDFWQVKNRQIPIVSALFTTFSDFFRLIKLYTTCCHYEL